MIRKIIPFEICKVTLSQIKQSLLFSELKAQVSESQRSRFMSWKSKGLSLLAEGIVLCAWQVFEPGLPQQVEGESGQVVTAQQELFIGPRGPFLLQFSWPQRRQHSGSFRVSSDPGHLAAPFHLFLYGGFHTPPASSIRWDPRQSHAHFIRQNPHLHIRLFP